MWGVMADGRKTYKTLKSRGPIASGTLTGTAGLSFGPLKKTTFATPREEVAPTSPSSAPMVQGTCESPWPQSSVEAQNAQVGINELVIAVLVLSGEDPTDPCCSGCPVVGGRFFARLVDGRPEIRFGPTGHHHRSRRQRSVATVRTPRSSGQHRSGVNAVFPRAHCLVFHQAIRKPARRTGETMERIRALTSGQNRSAAVAPLPSRSDREGGVARTT